MIVRYPTLPYEFVVFALRTLRHPSKKGYWTYPIPFSFFNRSSKLCILP